MPVCSANRIFLQFLSDFADHACVALGYSILYPSVCQLYFCVPSFFFFLRLYISKTLAMNSALCFKEDTGRGLGGRCTGESDSLREILEVHASPRLGHALGCPLSFLFFSSLKTLQWAKEVGTQCERLVVLLIFILGCASQNKNQVLRNFFKDKDYKTVDSDYYVKIIFLTFVA